ncbi:ABC transporter permease [Mesorhizobium sp. M1C.F.Ca.ET.193.01.1.1]|uniref:ABC transporter permease n=1 Tax=unclassified Mesorhizobium TaxID=325217 RepID=UPI000FD589CD|nr:MULTISPECIES: ABC transporter permease [unclassified Mesorhizobium]TGS91372.1 ABC transporter permease [bacterium M00.F.Ca.ET.177.01.1.1]TGQ49759.1 ABC transporter permease [Mesorhizobium sp. M1C.F.Ca.ET.210.01.1.1]TGQ63974.1 ABC transporter permease [Mesorhizobium sp. M1C.F.Ca.ET.212.01.1.1]TGQ97866.1 ABC transporter permease [Mesorhizobium sp. M1C.F.Ca.ET.204.01.1.1]TGR17907.1 ABC transporter permease [Mesorhizobium sp. M1C.F.Ca.ET.196.01.1.1]
MKNFFKYREIWLLAGIVLLIGLISTRFPGFADPANLRPVFNDTSILMILALGQMVVILTRSIDLSMASNLCFTGMVVAMLNAAHPAIPVPALIAIALLIGLVLGAINGLLVWRLNIPSIVVTLGTLTIYRGATFVVSGGAWVNADQMSPDFINFQRVAFLGLPVLSWIALFVIALFFLVMTRTQIGRSIHAIGVNPTASVYAGIDVGRTKFIVFCISGMIGGLAGYLWISRYVIASVEVANGYELNIIAACVIGGISIAGGIGSVGGAVLGALFLGIISNALPVINISPFWQMAISGTAIILAVVLNARGERRQGRIILRKAEAA